MASILDARRWLVILIAPLLAACAPGPAESPPAVPAPVPLTPVTPAPPAPRAATERLPTLPMPSPTPRDAPGDAFGNLGSSNGATVIALVGAPDERVPTASGESWLYRRRARGALGSEGYPEVRFQEGVVVQVTFHPTEESLLARRE